MDEFSLRIADKTWPTLSRLMGGHARIYRLSRGKIGHHIPGLPPMCLIDHVGARSGTKRTSPLLYIEDGDDIVIVASKGGYEKSPAWFYNLKANPDTRVQIGNEIRPVRAHVASEAERQKLWPKAVEVYPSYQQYQDRTKRKIPLVVLEKR
ncbi:MAG: nitroreductase family deazaflavin-dependent oxidoreductase [Solirubrobacterales bacterium]|nr:nitroreductase family deazaflavin-dependent oxidoreductase [Solirubrobacterales bacterium]